ncbi:MAG: hypothetical protein EXS16_03985 [Gemmataceae bacterium]|nr:hypothetical protein [Gemmataceae bacterium]
MATISFTCPHCEKVLRSTQRPPAGRNVKCPACNEGFVPELDNDEATGIQEEPRLKSKAKAVDDDVEEVDVDEVDDDEKPRKKKKSNRDDDDEDDGGARKKKKGKKKAGANKMLVYGGIALVGIGGLLSCVLVGVGAFVWPGFLLSKDSALFAFVAPDANVVVYADLKQTRTRMEPLEKMVREQNLGKNPGQLENNAMMDLMKNADKLVFSGNMAKSKDSMTVVVQVPAAEVEKFKKSPGMGAPTTIGGHANVYKPAGGGGGRLLPQFVAFPAADIVVFADQPEADFIRVLDRGKKGVQPNAAIDLGKSASGSLVWVAVVFNAEMRKDMKQTLQKFGAASKKMGAAATAVDGCKGIIISFDATNKQDLKIAATLTCKDAVDAVKMKDGLDDGFNQLRGFLALMQNAGGMMPGQAEMPKGIIQDLNSTAFHSQGNNATATLTITSQSLQELARFGEKKGGMGFFP